MVLRDAMCFSSGGVLKEEGCMNEYGFKITCILFQVGTSSTNIGFWQSQELALLRILFRVWLLHYLWRQSLAHEDPLQISSLDSIPQETLEVPSLVFAAEACEVNRAVRGGVLS